MSEKHWLPFYPSDWLGSPKLRYCTHEEKGVWIDLICLLHSGDEYGCLRRPLKDIAKAIGCAVKVLQSLRGKGVLDGADTGVDALTYQPKTGRRFGDSVELIPAQNGPLWYSKRMVIDEHKRAQRAAPNHTPNHTPKPPFGEAPNTTPNTTPNPSPSLRDRDPETIKRSEKELPSGSSKKKTRLPENFHPDEAGIAKAERDGVSVAVQLQKFMDYHTAKGSLMLDWQAAWRTWIGNVEKFSPRPAQKFDHTKKFDPVAFVNGQEQGGANVRVINASAD